jgi:hypothetical protein
MLPNRQGREPHHSILNLRIVELSLPEGSWAGKEEDIPITGRDMTVLLSVNTITDKKLK